MDRSISRNSISSAIYNSNSIRNSNSNSNEDDDNSYSSRSHFSSNSSIQIKIMHQIVNQILILKVIQVILKHQKELLMKEKDIKIPLNNIVFLLMKYQKSLLKIIISFIIRN